MPALYPVTPGGRFPLSSGRSAGGLYPVPEALRDAIKSLNPTAYWACDDASGNLADQMSGGYTATVTGTPTYAATAANPVAKGITWSGTGQYATTSTSIPTPTASVSILVIFSTTDTAAAGRYLAARQAANQSSWGLSLGTTHLARFTAFQSGGSNHCIAQTATALNDGAVHTVVASFDGTTARVASDMAAAATSTSLTGSWHTASTAAVSLAALATASLFPGTTYDVAYWADRVITNAERMWVHSIAKGG